MKVPDGVFFGGGFPRMEKSWAKKKTGGGFFSEGMGSNGIFGMEFSGCISFLFLVCSDSDGFSVVKSFRFFFGRGKNLLPRGEPIYFFHFGSFCETNEHKNAKNLTHFSGFPTTGYVVGVHSTIP